MLDLASSGARGGCDSAKAIVCTGDVDDCGFCDGDGDGVISGVESGFEIGAGAGLERAVDGEFRETPLLLPPPFSFETPSWPRLLSPVATESFVGWDPSSATLRCRLPRGKKDQKTIAEDG